MVRRGIGADHPLDAFDIDDAHKELTPTLQNVEKITAQVDPLIAHVDALVTDQIDRC